MTATTPSPSPPSRASTRPDSQLGRLILRGVSRAYGAHTALHPLDLDITGGEFIALLGPSGCGKTTALNCLAGLLPLTAGEIDWTAAAWTRCRRRSAASAWCSRTTRCSRT